jgi:hypothetical protein
MKTPEMEDDEMEEEYDFSKSEPAPYAAIAGDVHVVALDGDVWAAFPGSEAVNEALRGLMKAGTVTLPEVLQKAS